MQPYKPENNFQTVDDASLVYSLRFTGRFREGQEEMENDVEIRITARRLTDEQRADVARTICNTLNEKYFPLPTAAPVGEAIGSEKDLCESPGVAEANSIGAFHELTIILGILGIDESLNRLRKAASDKASAMPNTDFAAAELRILSAHPELRMRHEHIVELNPTQAGRLREWLDKPNGSHRPTSRVGFEAVCGGGLLVRTKPYGEEGAEREDKSTARAAMALADRQAEKRAIDDFDWLCRKMREVWVALAEKSGDSNRHAPSTWQQLAEDAIHLARQTMPLHCVCSDPSNDRDAPCGHLRFGQWW